MEITIICIAAFLTAILTFFSGFGLGTILTPVMMVFFPVDVAIALTGVVHFCNSLFKVVLMGRRADKQVLLRFGIPAVIAALAGSWLLLNIADSGAIFSYHIGSREFEVLPFKLFVSLLLIFFALMDLLPVFKNLHFGKRLMPVGGVLSGFFGGLCGNQGALRSAFLVKAGLSKEAFVATGAVLSCFVDFTRLSVYATRFTSAGLGDNLVLVVCAALAGITGSLLGNQLLKKVTLGFVQTFVAIMLILVSLAMGAGLV
jgi:uncharacterized membrane protein YfcA